MPFSFSIVRIPSMISWLMPTVPRRSGCPRTISSTGISCAVPPTETITAWSSAPTSVPRRRFALAVFSFTVPPIARRKCSGRRTGCSGPGEDTSIVQSAR